MSSAGLAASSALVQFGAEGQSGRGGGGGRAQLRLSLFPSITANGFDICVSIKSAIKRAAPPAKHFFLQRLLIKGVWEATVAQLAALGFRTYTP